MLGTAARLGVSTAAAVFSCETVRNLGGRRLGGTDAVPNAQRSRGRDLGCNSPLRFGPSASDALLLATNASAGLRDQHRLVGLQARQTVITQRPSSAQSCHYACRSPSTHALGAPEPAGTSGR